MRRHDFEFEQAKLDVVVEPGEPTGDRQIAARQAEARRPPAALDHEAVGYLRGIANHPGMAATKRDDVMGVSSKAGARLRKLLFTEGLICEHWDAPSQEGQSFRDLRVTAVGRDVLKANKPQPEAQQASMPFDA